MGDLSESLGTEKLDLEAASESTIEAKKPRLTALDSHRVCLFSNKEFKGVKKCLDHMRKKYSFTILDIDCLIDLKGLLTYLASRIHDGHLCLFCSRQFRTAQQCQQHMIDKGHCILNMEDEDEYVDYYDFSKTYKNHPLLIEDPNAIKEAGEENEDDGNASEGWEDCDLDDDEDGEESFEVIGESNSSEGFKIVDKDGNTDENITIDSKATPTKNEFEV